MWLRAFAGTKLELTFINNHQLSRNIESMLFTVNWGFFIGEENLKFFVMSLMDGN